MKRLLSVTALFLFFLAAAHAQPTNSSGRIEAQTPQGWKAQWNASNAVLIAQPADGRTSILFVGLRSAGETFDAPKIGEFVKGVTNTDTNLERRTPLRDGAIYQLISPDGTLRAKAIVKQRIDEVAFAVLITRDPAMTDGDVLRVVGEAARSARQARSMATRTQGNPPTTRTTTSGDARLFVGVRFRPSSTTVGGTGVTRYNLLLLPDGTAYAGVPPRGRLNVSRAVLQQHMPARIGSWTSSNGSIRVAWPSRSGAFARETYVIKGNELELRGTSLSPVHCPAGVQQISGTYQAAQSQSIGFTIAAPGQTSLTSARTLRFDASGNVVVTTNSGAAGRSGVRPRRRRRRR